MGYRAGDTVIVSHEEVNHVGVVLDKYVIGKQTVYDVLLESRLALIMLNTSSSVSYARGRKSRRRKSRGRKSRSNKSKSRSRKSKKRY